MDEYDFFEAVPTDESFSNVADLLPSDDCIDGFIGPQQDYGFVGPQQDFGSIGPNPMGDYLTEWWGQSSDDGMSSAILNPQDGTYTLPEFTVIDKAPTPIPPHNFPLFDTPSSEPNLIDAPRNIPGTPSTPSIGGNILPPSSSGNNYTDILTSLLRGATNNNWWFHGFQPSLTNPNLQPDISKGAKPIASTNALWSPFNPNNASYPNPNIFNSQQGNNTNIDKPIGLVKGPVLDPKFAVPFEGNQTDCYKYNVKMFKNGGFFPQPTWWGTCEIDKSWGGEPGIFLYGLGSKNTLNPEKVKLAVSYIKNQIDSGFPVMVGVSVLNGNTPTEYDYTEDNKDDFIGHYVTIVGYGYTGTKLFFWFYDPSGSSPVKNGNQFILDGDKLDGHSETWNADLELRAVVGNRGIQKTK